MLRKVLCLVLSVFCVVAFVGCGGKSASSTKEKKLEVMASFYPIAEFTRQVGGSHVTVNTMIPDGVEPHDWEPTAKDIEKLGKSAIFFYNGGVEPWAEKAIAALGEKKITGVEVAHGLMTEVFHEEHEEDSDHHDAKEQHEEKMHHDAKDKHDAKDRHEEKEHREDKAASAGHHHQHDGQDPHVWVSPKQAMEEVKIIAAELGKKDPAHKADYDKNAEAYLKKLSDLDKQLKDLGKVAKRKEVVTTHAAFSYLAKDYGFTQLSIMGLSPDAEPAPKDMTNLVNLIREKGIKVVFFETLVSPKVAQTIAKTAGVSTLVLNPLEGLTAEEKKAGADYISVMQENINNLKKALVE